MMKKQQSGFTLVEIAIVLVIIGLLLGGVLKGQELINSAKVKNFANDFRNIPLFIYGYQDRFRAIPGDDIAVVDHLGAAATRATTPVAADVGNGTINGAWNSITLTDESVLFWQHVRLANLATGSTTVAANNTFLPTNADSGRIGIEAGSLSLIQNSTAGVANGTFLQGAFVICSTGIPGRFALQLDTTLDDGDPQTGSVRVTTTAHVRGAIAATTVAIQAAAETAHTVCMGL